MAVPVEAQSAVDHLRRFGSASSTDVFDGGTYWSDDQLYEILRGATDFKQVYLTSIDKDCTVYTHRLPKHYWLKESSIQLDPDLSYTYDATECTLTFVSTPSSAPLLYVTVWNMNHALADLWEAKAAQRYELLNVKAGSNQLFMEQEYNHCVYKANQYRSREIRRFKR